MDDFSDLYNPDREVVGLDMYAGRSLNHSLEY